MNTRCIRFSVLGFSIAGILMGCNLLAADTKELTFYSFSDIHYGANIVVVTRPVRNGVASGWFSLVDVFYDRLVLGVRGDSGLVCIRLNGKIENSTTTIPDGQLTILSLVVLSSC